MSSSPSKGRQNNWNIIADHLSRQTAKRVDLTFDEVNQWVAGGLPPSAHKYSAWWSGKRATWTDDGWVATPNFEQKTVVFRKE